MRKMSGLLFCFIMSFFHVQGGRNVHRQDDPGLAEIRTRWLDENKQPSLTEKEYSLKGNEYDPHTLFKLVDYEHIYKHLLPMGPITYRNSEETIDGSVLDAEISQFIEELRKSKGFKKEYKNFKILKKNNYNPKKNIGALIVKFKKYPFVVKLFIETPHSFVRPYFRDLEQNCLFTMGGGISRYLVGFTRIKNLNYIKYRVAGHPFWSNKMRKIIRKWFWLPKKNRWFELKGYAIGGIPEQRIILPSVYATISDAIEAERVLSPYNSEDRRLVLSLTTWLDERLDPNIPNYMIEKGTGDFVFVDTEHFPTNLGMRKRLYYDSYLTWYSRMVHKYIRENYCRTKRKRLEIRDGKIAPIMRIPKIPDLEDDAELQIK